jgi:hypothetical protein
MATRSTIALEYADGSVGQVYCHWDGYLEHNGEILLKHYSDPFKLQQLIDLGDVSSLGPEIGVQHAFEDRTDDCTFYGRDRGETGVEAKSFKSFEDYAENHQHEEYEYCLRRDGHWYVKCYEGAYELLADKLADQLIEQGLTEDA